MTKVVAAISITVAAATIHSLSWLAFSPGLQGQWLNVSQFFVVATFCYALYVALTENVTKDETILLFVGSAAILIDTFVTSFCSLSWIFLQWEIRAGEEQCTKKYGVPISLFSASVYAFAVAMISSYKDRGKDEH